MIIFNDAAFDVVKGLFFFGFGLVMWSLSAKLTKSLSLKRYLKGTGMSIQLWNTYTKGLTIDDLKKF